MFLGTHQLILGRGVWNLSGAGILFLKCFNKPMKRERNFGGRNIFFENSIAPSPPRINWCVPYHEVELDVRRLKNPVWCVFSISGMFSTLGMSVHRRNTMSTSGDIMSTSVHQAEMFTQYKSKAFINLLPHMNHIMY